MSSTTRPIPKSARTAFALLLARQTEERDRLARDVCDDMGIDGTVADARFDVKAGTVTVEVVDAEGEPGAPAAP